MPEKWRVPAAMASLSAAAMFLVGGYEFVRSVSTSLYIDAYGSAALPYAMTAIPPALALLVYAYGLCLSRWGAMRALAATTIFSAAVFAACHAALLRGFAPAAALLYVYRQAYIVLIVEQYWSLINSTLTPEEGKLYNGPIIGGASVGPILAGLLLNRLAQRAGSEVFILLAAASLLPAALLSYAAYRLAGEPVPGREEARGGEGHLHLSLFARSRTLTLLAVIVALTQVVATMFSLRFYGLLEASIPAKDARTAYLGGFWSLTNGVSFALQFILTPIVMRRASPRLVQALIPVLHVAACAVLLLYPTLPVAAAALLLFKGFDYSLFRAAKEILYIPLSFDARYRAKQVIDSFAYRFAKGGSAGLMSLFTAAAGTIPGAAYAVSAGFAAALWAGCAAGLSDEVKSPRAS